MRSRILFSVLASLALFGVSLAIAADRSSSPSQAPPPSSFAPAEDLSNQVDFFVKHIEDVLADQNSFDDAAQSRVKKDGNTLVALFLTLGLHDTKNRFRDSAAQLINESKLLAQATSYDAAKKHFDALRKIMAEGDPPNGNTQRLAWDKAASLDQLMKQVPTVNAALKRSTTPQRFKSMQQQSGGQSATLAAIAQTVMPDTSAVKNPADLEKWYQYCAEMRTAAAAVNSAIHADDQEATAKSMSRLAASCETCHAVFRKE